MTLDTFLKTHGLTSTAFAAMIGRSQSFVSRMRTGEAMPSVETLQAIHRVTRGKVTPLDFARREQTLTHIPNAASVAAAGVRNAAISGGPAPSCAAADRRDDLTASDRPADPFASSRSRGPVKRRPSAETQNAAGDVVCPPNRPAD